MNELRTVMRLSKLDAATRQLETALRLFFSGGDPVSIYTLGMAAHDILAALAKHRGLATSGFKTEMLKSIRPEKKDEIRKLLSRDQSFFKHADRDPEGVTDFPPRVTQVFLWWACGLYQSLTDGHQTPLMALFRVWVGVARPEFFSDPQIKLAAVKAARVLKPENRRGFLELLPAFEEELSGARP